MLTIRVYSRQKKMARWNTMSDLLQQIRQVSIDVQHQDIIFITESFVPLTYKRITSNDSC